MKTLEYEYEMFFNSGPEDPMKIYGWYPIATDRIVNPEKIEEYIANGILRRVGTPGNHFELAKKMAENTMEQINNWKKSRNL